MARFRIEGTNWEGRPWVLAPSMVVLARQIEALHPEKHKADGTVASKAHDKANPSSGHRPKPFTGRGTVRALDAGEVTENDAFKMAESVRLSKDKRIRIVIHENRIYSSYGSQPYVWRKYTGPAPHDTHVHFETLPEYDGDTRPWVITSTTPAPKPPAPSVPWGPQDEENELSPTEFAKQLDTNRIDALCQAKVGGTWVIGPNSADRAKEATYWKNKLSNLNDPEWANFYRAVLGGGQMQAAMEGS